MNKRLYLGIYIGSFAFAILTGVVSAVMSLTIDRLTSTGAISPVFASSPLVKVIFVLSALGMIQFFLVLTFYPFILLAKMWGSIQDGITPITPAKAIGFLFIPFFNLYWIFRAWGGYSTEYNSYAARHNLNVLPLQNGLFICYAIFVLLAGVLYIPVIALPFLLVPLIAKSCDAVNDLRSAAVRV